MVMILGKKNKHTLSFCMQSPIKKIPSHTVFINVTKSQKDSNNEFITVTFHE